MKNYQRLFIGILLAVIVVQVSYLLKDSFNRERAALKITEAPVVLDNPEMLRQKDLWSARMDQVGAEQAYAEFKELYKNENFGNQHMMAHIVGQMIYEKSGIRGLGVCDSTFAFGCYHSFFSQALLGEGLSIIKKLDEECLDKFGPLGSGCQHGIGHGVMEYFGPDQLLAALEACKDTTAKSELAGCVSGVFMEYNVPILITEASASASARTMENNDPYAPCPSLPAKFQPSCYHEIPQWWQQGPYFKNFKKHGELCLNVPNPEQKENCFLGLGNIIAPASNYEVAPAIEVCGLMPNEESRVFCQAGASWSFDANPDYRNLATQLCGGLGVTATTACERRAHLLNPENQ